MEPDTLIKLISTIIILIFFRVCFIVAKLLIKKVAEKKQLQERRQMMAVKYFLILSWILVFISAIIIWGITVNGMFTIVSSLFALLGIAFFAVWSILSNITAGLIIFFAYPIKIGSHIIIYDGSGQIEGEVINIGLFHIKMKSEDGYRNLVPNNLFFQKHFTIIKDPPMEEHSEGEHS